MKGAARVHEVYLSAEVVGILQASLAGCDEAVLLGRRFGGGVVVTAVLPLPVNEDAWEKLHRLEHGPVGRVTRRRGAALRSWSEALPDDILLQASPPEDPGAWRAHCLDPGAVPHMREVPLTGWE